MGDSGIWTQIGRWKYSALTTEPRSALFTANSEHDKLRTTTKRTFQAYNVAQNINKMHVTITSVHKIMNNRHPKPRSRHFQESCSAKNKLCWRPPQYAPAPCKLTFDVLTLKVVSESRVTWATSVPILVFIGFSVLDLGPMYATDRQTSDAHHRLMPLL